ncbi:unnamed protein product [Rotaria magnacalcarata]|uniref:Chorein N-terminal domain-containing protein n=1 Tax=Rotaria magnacalcarata TaxID=392030 RepID=A0A816XKP4_9BILA|nr:unnamed protein product [Rotaria magnacalcarata]
MVLKMIVRYLINKYMKDYIEKLDDEKLKLDLKHGKVSLENLHMKPEALIGFGVPVTVAAGFIEKLSIVIPWKNLRSHRTTVNIDGFYVLIVPKNEIYQDLHEYHAEKMKRVQRKLDTLRKTALDEKKSNEKDKSFFEKVKLQMLQNLEINLRNFHVSYETKSTTKLGHPFSFGVTIHYLQLTTTTNTKRMEKVTENSLVIAELKEIQWLSLYWNTNCRSRINLPFENILDDLKSKIATDDKILKTDEMNYVLHPTNLNLELSVAIKCAEQNFERPTFKIKYKIAQMSFEIDPKQLSDLLDFVKFQNYSVFYDRCREYRQLCVKDLIGNIKLIKEEQERIEILESKLDVFTMAYIRHSLELETHLYSNTYSHEDYSWWNWWWSERASVIQDQRSITTTNMNNEEEFFSEELLDIDAEVIMNRLEFTLLSTTRKTKLNEKNQIISHIIIDNTRIDYKRRAISSSILLAIDLGYFRIFGLKCNDHNQPLILTSSSDSLNSLVHIELELAPINKKSDYRFSLTMEPMAIIYDAATINEIVAQFEPIDENDCVVSSQIKQRTIKEIEKNLSNEKIFEMTMQIKGLSLLSPEYGVFKHNCKTTITRFSSLIFKSCLNNDTEDDATVFQQTKRERSYYKKYKLLLNDFSFIYSKSNNEQCYIIKAIPLLETNFYKCIYSDDAQLTDWRMGVQISKMTEIELSEVILTKLIDHHQSIPLFNPTMSQTLNRMNLFFKIISSHTSIECDISISKSSLIIKHSRTSIETDLHCHITKTRNECSKSIALILKNVSMTLHSSLISIQLSRSFYQNNVIALLYSDANNKL